jgi:geranylgeranyl transferase type-1 subunit beta
MDLWKDENFSAQAQYFRACLLRGLSENYSGLDSNRMTLAYFCVSGLDLLGELRPSECLKVIVWVKAQMNEKSGGFRGSPFFNSVGDRDLCWDVGHIAMTYTGLAMLAICGEDLRRIDRSPIISFVKSLQTENGGFRCHSMEEETDLRFLFRNRPHHFDCER